MVLSSFLNLSFKSLLVGKLFVVDCRANHNKKAQLGQSVWGGEPHPIVSLITFVLHMVFSMFLVDALCSNWRTILSCSTESGSRALYWTI